MALKKIFAPHLNRYVKMGRRRSIATCPHLSLRNYLGASVNPLPAAPATCDFSAPAKTALANIFDNDKYGDCVIAGGYHIVGVETGNAGKLFTPTEQQILADYHSIGGFDPANPEATDNGCDMQTALNYWTQHGFANGTKLLGWLGVDPTNQAELMSAVYLFENLYLALELPDAYVNPFPIASGFTWDDGTPDMYNGHCIMAMGYTARGLLIDTWGLTGTLTWKAISHLCSDAGGGELYVMLTPDQLAKGQTKAPNGVAWADVIKDFNLIGGKVPAPTPPAPTPPAPPAPTPPTPTPVAPTATLAQAIAWAQKGVADAMTANWPKK